jgi:negative regulator of sigma E activity
MVRRLKALRQEVPGLTAEEFDARFDAALGAQETPAEIPELDDATRDVVATIMRERPAWEATIPCDALAALPFRASSCRAAGARLSKRSATSYT